MNRLQTHWVVISKFLHGQGFIFKSQKANEAALALDAFVDDVIYAARDSKKAKNDYKQLGFVLNEDAKAAGFGIGTGGEDES